MKSRFTLPRPHSDHTFVLLLVALLFMLTVVPIMEHEILGSLLANAGSTAIFATAILAHRDRGRLFWIEMLLAAVALLFTWLQVFVPSKELRVSALLSAIVFYASCAAMILISVLTERKSTLQALAGALCVYLLTGLTWALVYSTIEYLDSPKLGAAVGSVGDMQEPFGFMHRIEGEVRSDGQPLTAFSQMVYFSFVTMSTLGYGDITPQTPVAQTACWLQSVLGQFYLAIMVAWLVGALPKPAHANRKLRALAKEQDPGPRI